MIFAWWTIKCMGEKSQIYIGGETCVISRDLNLGYFDENQQDTT